MTRVAMAQFAWRLVAGALALTTAFVLCAVRRFRVVEEPVDVGPGPGHVDVWLRDAIL